MVASSHASHAQLGISPQGVLPNPALRAHQVGMGHFKQGGSLLPSLFVSRGDIRSRCSPNASGFFSSDAAAIGCLNCDDLGDFFQNFSGQAGCAFCPLNTQRYLGLLSGANSTACQCKPGETPTPIRATSDRRASRCVRQFSLLVMQSTTTPNSKPGRWGSASLSNSVLRWSLC